MSTEPQIPVPLSVVQALGEWADDIERRSSIDNFGNLYLPAKEARNLIHALRTVGLPGFEIEESYAGEPE